MILSFIIGYCKYIVCVCERERESSEILTVGWIFGPILVKQNQNQTVVKAVKMDFLQELLQ